jgi:hypothetical protein
VNESNSEEEDDDSEDTSNDHSKNGDNDNLPPLLPPTLMNSNTKSEHGNVQSGVPWYLNCVDLWPDVRESPGPTPLSVPPSVASHTTTWIPGGIPCDLGNLVMRAAVHVDGELNATRTLEHPWRKRNASLGRNRWILHRAS